LSNFFLSSLPMMLWVRTRLDCVADAMAAKIGSLGASESMLVAVVRKDLLLSLSLFRLASF
jgi:hypothetical protein